MKKRSRFLTDDEKRWIIDEYIAGKPFERIAIEMERGRNTVYEVLVKSNTKRRNGGESNRVYYHRESAFDQAEEDDAAAYWVGFLMADGSVKIRKSGQHLLVLGLAKPDGGHVGKLKMFLEAGNPLKEEKNDRGFSNGTPLICLRITSKRLVQALARYGVTPKKSSRERAKLLTNHKHFWRGMMDGDGWVSMSNGYPRAGITGSYKIMEQFSRFASRIVGKLLNIKRNNSIWAVSTTGIYAVRLLGTLYGADGTSLERKQKIADLALLWSSSKTDRSAWTLTFLSKMKEQYGTWDYLGKQLGVSGGSLAVRYSKLVKISKRGA